MTNRCVSGLAALAAMLLVGAAPVQSASPSSSKPTMMDKAKSTIESATVKPLNKPMMEWFYANLTNGSGDMRDSRLDIVGKADLKGLPPATVITDQIDPLQTEGEALASKLKRAGVQVDAHNYDGVTHEFFGMGMVVGKAKQAEDVAVKNLKAAFAKSS